VQTSQNDNILYKHTTNNYQKNQSPEMSRRVLLVLVLRPLLDNDNNIHSYQKKHWVGCLSKNNL
jgi:hypothetical protein